jgi:hypothetical protein
VFHSTAAHANVAVEMPNFSPSVKLLSGGGPGGPVGSVGGGVVVGLGVVLCGGGITVVDDTTCVVVIAVVVVVSAGLVGAGVCPTATMTSRAANATNNVYRISTQQTNRNRDGAQQTKQSKRHISSCRRRGVSVNAVREEWEHGAFM